MSRTLTYDQLSPAFPIGGRFGRSAGRLSAGMVRTRQSNQQNLRIGSHTARYLFVALLFVAGLFYLHQSATSTTEQTEISQLQSQLQDIQHQTSQLETEQAAGQALNAIEQSKDKFQLEAVPRPDFVVSSGGGFIATH